MPKALKEHPPRRVFLDRIYSPLVCMRAGKGDAAYNGLDYVPVCSHQVRLGTRVHVHAHAHAHVNVCMCFFFNAFYLS